MESGVGPTPPWAGVPQQLAPGHYGTFVGGEIRRRPATRITVDAIPPVDNTGAAIGI
jgi:hypothetical protein